MNKIQEFFDSRLFSDLKQGHMPEMPVKVGFQPSALLDTCAALFFTAVAILLASHLIKKL